MKINQDFGMAVEMVLYLQGTDCADFVQSAEIARRLGFSVGYLQKVVQNLSRHGILECKRGRIGGVRLKAECVTLLKLWEITCGTLDFTDPQICLMDKPLKAFRETMQKTVVG